MVTLRELGKPGAKLNPLGLGCMGMCDGIYGAADDVESRKVLHRALDLGCVFWDISDVYGKGTNELFLSETLKSHRSKIFLCTKFGIHRDPKTGLVGTVCGKPDYGRESCEKSLQRLGIDTIDLYYLHRVDPNTPIKETVAAMAKLVEEGKVRYLDYRNAVQKHFVVPTKFIQLQLFKSNIHERRVRYLPRARYHDCSILAPGSRILKGSIKSLDDLPAKDYRRLQPRFFPENFEKNLALVKKIEEIASMKRLTVSQLTLAWILAQGPKFYVIPGTKRLIYLEQNMKAGEVELTSEEVKAIRTAINGANPQGDRYPEASMKALDI
ncbi:aldo/keto reductase [Fennellomyces sp. T-0311]|nr:aldo/keto reductase [Fennellomyces sp. T-0311]